MQKWWEDPEPKAPEVEYVTITKMIPQVVYDTIYEAVIEYERIYINIIEQLPPNIIYEYVYEIVYDILVRDPTEDEIREYIKDNLIEVIKIIKEDPKYIEIIMEVIKEIPPEEIYIYLTDEQIKYVIQQQPPEVILQAVKIIDIEFVIFSGNSVTFNGNSPVGGTNLSAQEKSANETIVNVMAQALVDDTDCLIMLHGHANPTTFTEGEKGELEQISMDRAKSVETALRAKFKTYSGGKNIDDTRVTVSGYGGGKNLFGSNSTYAGLNRRVEMILVQVK
jgi:outer membrane protein OmpA-like peptidoglycan-associated protein